MNSPIKSQIWEIFEKLDQGFKYMQSNPAKTDQIMGLLDRSEKYYSQLKELGVNPQIGALILMFGFKTISGIQKELYEDHMVAVR